MLKFFNTNQKNFSKKLESILNLRKSKQKYKSATVKKILLDVKKKGIKLLLNMKKFSKIKSNSNKIVFTNEEINKISKINRNVKNSIDLAYNRIKKFHSKQKIFSI